MRKSFSTYVLANLLIALFAAAFSCLSVVLCSILTAGTLIYTVIALRSIAQEGDSARVVAGISGTVGMSCLAVLLAHFELTLPACLAFVVAIAISVYFGHKVYGR